MKSVQLSASVEPLQQLFLARACASHVSAVKCLRALPESVFDWASP